MKNKKNPARFCIQFDMNNSKHREAVSYLNDKGRNTAEYIANTICFYESNMFSNKVVKDREMPPLPDESSKANNETNNFDFNCIAESLNNFRK